MKAIASLGMKNCNFGGNRGCGTENQNSLRVSHVQTLPSRKATRQVAGIGLGSTSMTERSVLSIEKIHPSIREKIANNHRDIISEVQEAIKTHAVVVVGMGQNPVVKKARKLIEAQGTTFHYLEYGNYFNTWRRRNALKMWTGWPTFPMVFIRGTLIGGGDEVAKLIESGEFKALVGGDAS